jgi:type VI protein secretion system component VasF
LTTIEKIAAKLDEIASRASTRRDVGQLVDALRDAVSTIAKLGALPTEMTPEERLRVCYDAMERIAQELGA